MTKTPPVLPLFSHFDTKKKILCGMQVPAFVWISSDKSMLRCDVITAFLAYEEYKLESYKDFIVDIKDHVRIVRYKEQTRKELGGVYLIVCTSDTPKYIKDTIRRFSNIHDTLAVGGYKALDTKEEYFDYVKGAMIEEMKQCLLVSTTDHEFPKGHYKSKIPIISTLKEVKARNHDKPEVVHDLVFEIDDWCLDKEQFGPYVKLSTDDEDLLFGPNSPNFMLARCTEKEIELREELHNSWKEIGIKVDWSEMPTVMTIATRPE